MSGMNRQLIKLALVGIASLALGLSLISDGDIFAGVVIAGLGGACILLAGYIGFGMRDIEFEDD